LRTRSRGNFGTSSSPPYEGGVAAASAGVVLLSAGVVSSRDPNSNRVGIVPPSR
jgi:hypothetical protein